MMSIIQILFVGIVLAAGVEALSPLKDGCLEDSDCTSNRCQTSTNTCVTALGDDCKALAGTAGISCFGGYTGFNDQVIQQFCNSETKCVECIKNDQCPDGKTCQADGACGVPALALASGCEEGWIEVEGGCDGSDAVCIKMERPIKFISWIHMQYECDAIGGFLPEPFTAGLSKQFELLLKGYEQLYGETMFYLGASDLTHTGTWKWSNQKGEVSLAADDWITESEPAENSDCMAKISTPSEKYKQINCEDNSRETQVAFMCMATKK